MGARLQWPFRDRRKRILDSLKAGPSDAIIIADPYNILYVTGIREPTGFLVLSENCGDYIITSILDLHRIQALAPIDVEVLGASRAVNEYIKTNISPAICEGDLIDCLKEKIAHCGRILADLSNLKVGTAERLKKALEGREILDIAEHLYKIRSVKDSWELERIKEAIEITEAALRRAINALNEDLSESELAGLIYSTILKNGAWREAFPPIVAFHENSAYPHHTPTPRKLGAGGAVLLDLGSVVDGYNSDMTRTLWYGNAPREFKEALESVIEAQDAAIDVGGPGVEAMQLDKAARSVLEKKDLASYFIHGLGHGVGVEIHEHPYIRPGSREVLEKGMVFTIEPGVYIPGLYGIRVEDMVVVTERGLRPLTSFSRMIVL